MGRALRETDTIIVVLFFGGDEGKRNLLLSLSAREEEMGEGPSFRVLSPFRGCRARPCNRHKDQEKLDIYSSWFSNFAFPGNGTSTVYFPLALLCGVRRNSKGI